MSIQRRCIVVVDWPKETADYRGLYPWGPYLPRLSDWVLRHLGPRWPRIMGLMDSDSPVLESRLLAVAPGESGQEVIAQVHKAVDRFSAADGESVVWAIALPGQLLARSTPPSETVGRRLVVGADYRLLAAGTAIGHVMDRLGFPPSQSYLSVEADSDRALWLATALAHRFGGFQLVTAAGYRRERLPRRFLAETGAAVTVADRPTLRTATVWITENASPELRAQGAPGVIYDLGGHQPHLAEWATAEGWLYLNGTLSSLPRYRSPHYGPPDLVSEWETEAVLLALGGRVAAGAPSTRLVRQRLEDLAYLAAGWRAMVVRFLGGSRVLTWLDIEKLRRRKL
ncbi:MAG: hypothetical protein AB1331_05100 [Bacillota bacterium]